MQLGWHRGVLVCLVVLALQATGCSSPYLVDRGNDALDIMDLGLTVTPRLKPDLGFYFNFFDVTPVGYSHVRGRFYGLARRQFGGMDVRDDSWGVLLWGSEELQVGEFNPMDPHQVSQSEIRALQEAGEPLPERARRYNVGVVRFAAEDNAPPWPTFLCCRRMFHVGWIGVHNAMRPIDLVDFILGWSGLDIVGDDVSG
ncbi:MAG: hypothetical protein ACYS8L_06040 [Planctomycetota bacterium]